jgi:hypothetical protein
MMEVITSNIISFFIGGILGVSINIISKRLFSTNKKFFEIIEEFKKKLPPSNKKAVISQERTYTHMHLKNLKHNVTQTDVDMFLRELENIEYNKMVFKRKNIEGYSRNIQRIINTTNWDKFLIGLLDEMLELEKLNDRRLFLINKSFYNYIGL